ncbi:MAG: hypothetical protein AAGF81_04605 [Pseudomonadota bacterium]
MSIFKIREISTLALIGTMIALSGCSSRPIIDDVTPHNTYRIVQLIRCEIQSALRLRTRNLLIAAEETALLNGVKQPGGYRNFIENEIDNIKDQFSRTVARSFASAFAAYEFEFDITEDNNLSAGVDFLEVMTLGTFKLGVNGKLDRQRRNKRNFKALDNFGQLLGDDILHNECASIRNGSAGISGAAAGLLYPISGRLGLREKVDTFLGLNLAANLVGSTKEAPRVPTTADRMTFTTTVSGTVNPVIQLMPTSRQLKFAGTAVNTTSSRKDIHMLTLSMTLPTQGDLAADKPLLAQQLDVLARTALAELERQRIRELDDEDREIRDLLLGN